MNQRTDDDGSLGVTELAELADVTPRTVHYYVAQGLLPAAGSAGRGARYGPAHRDRLLLIRQLQREHLPLAEIRRRLDELGDDQVADLLAQRGESRPSDTAFDYVQALLATPQGSRPPAVAPSVPPPAFRRLAQSRLAYAPEPSPGRIPPPAHALSAPVGEASLAPPPLPSPAAIQPRADLGSTQSARSQWERITLAPDVELHVRRPLSRIQNRAVDRLVALARKLLEEDTR